MIKIEIHTDNAAWFEESPASELDYVLDQVQRLALDTPMGPNGFVKALMDSNGNVTGKLTVTPC